MARSDRFDRANRTAGEVEKQSVNIRRPSGGCRPGAGRPKGVPNRITRPLKEIAAQLGPDAIQEVQRLMHESTNDVVRLAAARELLDRGLGRPAQSVAVTAGPAFMLEQETTENLMELKAMLEERRRQQLPAPTPDPESARLMNPWDSEGKVQKA